ADLEATGLELPFRDSIHDDPAWLASQLAGRFTDSIIADLEATGLELPFRDSIHDDPAWLASQLAGRFT
ncbi:hypothetical protein BUE64_14530, partial [Corynebacterium diphtheriae subsp. lausannense]